MIIVTNKKLGLDNRLVVIDTMLKTKNKGIEFKVWNASKNWRDEEFTISENDIVKKMPSYKKGDYILLKDWNTGVPKPMIMSVHIELGLFEMCDLEGFIKNGEDYEWVEEPYYNIVRKMTKRDLEKYKSTIEEYHLKKDSNKYNL